MPTCREITERSNDFLDGELGFWAAMEFRFHLLACKYCRGFINQMRTVVDLVQMHDDKMPPGEIDQELLAALKKQAGNPPE